MIAKMPDADRTSVDTEDDNRQPSTERQNQARAARTGTSEDLFLGDLLRIRQPLKGYRAGIDAVLLAATALPGEGPLLDLGAGVGTVGLCAAARCPDLSVALVERETELAGLARENISANGFDRRISVIEADICVPLPQASRTILRDASFAHVLANPPFHDDASGTRARWPLKAVAHAMTWGALELWLKFMARMTEPGGRATIIHKAEALPLILKGFENRFGAITVLPIHPRSGEPAIRVIVDGIKGSRAPLKIASGLVLHGDGNGFLPEIDAILRHGAALRT
jgi:tRNA1(Val) A37 N6-methylase TrmN6